MGSSHVWQKIVLITQVYINIVKATVLNKHSSLPVHTEQRSSLYNITNLIFGKFHLKTKITLCLIVITIYIYKT